MPFQSLSQTKRFQVTLLVAFSVLLLPCRTPAQSSYDLRSPDNHIDVRIRTANGLHYDVLFDSRTILEDSTASIDVDHKTLGRETKVLHAKTQTHDETLEPVVHQKFAKIRDRYKELRLEMAGNYAVTFRAYNEGVAYRIETSLPQKDVKVYSEEMQPAFLRGSHRVLPARRQFHVAQRAEIFAAAPGGDSSSSSSLASPPSWKSTVA